MAPSHTHVHEYRLYWSGPSKDVDNTTVSTQYTISGLVSNTPYNVTVEAISEIGNRNSTTRQLFTSPKGDNNIIMQLPRLC